MRFKVAIVGHSQVPTHIPINDSVEIKIFRRSGAKLVHLQQSPLRDVYNYRPNLCIFYMGGNDIAASDVDCREVIGNIRDALLSLKAIAQKVVFVNIEERRYAVGNRHGVDTDTYNTHRKWVNSNLRRFLRINGIGTINVSGPWFASQSVDGVHFNKEAKRVLVRKICSYIQGSRDSNQV